MRIAFLSVRSAQAAALRRWLTRSGHSLSSCETLDELVATLKSDSYDALIISEEAADERALDQVAAIRGQRKLNIPLILTTPHQSESFVVRALSQGADDYMASPVREREFLARIEALTRRTWHSPTMHRPIQAGRLEVSLGNRRIFLDGAPLQLTIKDFDLAVLLLRNIGRVISRTRILQAVWGKPRAVRSRTVDTHISRVRVKLKLNEANGWRLTALYRYGYRLERLDDSSPPANAAKQERGLSKKAT
jgi:two-component system response regulator RegX3